MQRILVLKSTTALFIIMILLLSTGILQEMNPMPSNASPAGV
jgi:hypothetical protein